MSGTSHQKSLGAFYTPEPMAAALVDWAVRSPGDTVLDPSFGGLVFLREAERRLGDLGVLTPATQLYGADVDGHAFEAASDLAARGATLVRRSFLRTSPAGRLLPRATAVVGNPPYIRYQSFVEGREHGRRIAARKGINLTRLASSWAPLLIHAADFVEPGGRLAQVLPAELVHAQYAGQVLEYVCARFERVIVAMFDDHVFPGAQEEVVLLCAENRGGPAAGIELLSFRDLDELDLSAKAGPAVPARTDHKLLAGLLKPEALAVYDELAASPQTNTLGELASVDIGAVTGANDFFVRPAGVVSDVPSQLLRKAVSKAVHIPGARFSKTDLDAMDEQGLPTRMLVIDPDGRRAPPSPVRRLIEEGEEQGIHRRYKCRIREPWWALPASQVAQAPHLFLTYMSSEFPRLVANELGALSTNSVHGVRLYNGTAPKTLAVGFYSSLTMLSAELVGRSYGGGVLKLEPTEAERLVLPLASAKHGRLLNQVDALLRDRRHAELASLVDEAVLVQHMGVPSERVALLRNAAAHLRGRRHARATRGRRRGA